MNAMTKAEGKVEKVEATTAAGAATAATLPETKPEPRKRRRGLRLLLMALVPVALVVGGGYYWITGGRIQETDNANLRQAKVTIASEIGGRVVQANVAENKQVKTGDVLLVVDPQPYRIALEQADAALAGARLNVEQLRASYSQAVAQEKETTSEVAYLQTQLDRQRDLSGKGFASRQVLDQAETDLRKAQESHAGSEQAVAGALAALGGDPKIETDKHPTVLSALAARDKAAYDLGQTTVRAPADGVVSQASSFKIGQYVNVGTALFSLVETGDTWVEANFKETQLTNMRPGQEAEVVLDTYPGQAFKATVESIGAGTGAEFSLLPAQNATGNWVKVTQRIPVRLKLHTEESDLPVRTGMSADVSVDTKVSRGIGSLFGKAFAGE